MLGAFDALHRACCMVSKEDWGCISFCKRIFLGSLDFSTALYISAQAWALSGLSGEQLEDVVGLYSGAVSPVMPPV